MKQVNPKNTWKRALLAAAFMGPMVAMQAEVTRLGVASLCKGAATVPAILICKASYFNGAVFMICFGLYCYGLFNGGRGGNDKG
jgi:hypothetical protein